MGKKVNLINKLSVALADLYQIIGGLDLELDGESEYYKQNQDILVSYMDIIVDLLNESDSYYKDSYWTENSKWIDEKLKHYRILNLKSKKE